MKLREYQSRGVEEIRQAFTRSRRVLYVLPTGGGKTLLFSYIARGVAAKQKRVTVLCHRDFLHRQICAALEGWQVPHGRLKGGSKFTTRAPVTVASVFTLVNRLERYLPPDLLIVDEAHHFGHGNSWNKVAKAFPNARILGVTATPVRSDGIGLADSFDEMVVGPQVIDLTMQGFLSPAEVYAPPVQMNLKGVHVRGGDYVASELADEMDKPTITGDAVSHYTRLAPNSLAVVFCCSIKHAEDVAAAFNAAGYAAASVHGKMDQFDIDQVFLKYARGEIRVVTACDLISEGLDIPKIETVIMLRPTKSMGLYLQMVGRGIRPAPGKTKTLVLDHCGNVKQHGFIDEIRDWKLTGTLEKQSRAEAAPAVRTCPFCFACFRPAPVCPVCGAAQPVQSRQVQHVDGELERVTAADEIFAAAETENRDRQFEILTRIAKDRGMRAPEQWAYHVMAAQTAADRRKREEYTPGYRTVNGLPESDDAELKARVERAMAKEGW